ncbi:MAG: hypothetical protein RR048_01870 [Oscillospiraceae bacterium]
MLIVLGSISIENSNVNDMVTLYSDSLKAIGLPENNEINISNHIDSRVFLLGNIVINTVGINLNNNLDELSVITFNEELVKLLNDI